MLPMRLKDDAFEGLSNKKKRDRLLLDLMDNPDLMDSLNPESLVAFMDFLEMDALDQAGINDIACALYLSRGQREKALEVARITKTQVGLAGRPIYARFAEMVLTRSNSEPPFEFLERAFRNTELDIVYSYGETLIEDAN